MSDWPKCWRVRSIPAIYGLDHECDLCTPHGKGKAWTEASRGLLKSPIMMQQERSGREPKVR
jgi:hypothetical protein